MLAASFAPAPLFAQNSIDELLQQVANNNPELKALQAYAESRRLELKTTNNLQDPQFDFFLLPLGTHSTGNYSEFQLSQSFEFPTVYGARKSWIEAESEKLGLEYEQRRQQILLDAKKQFHTLVYLNKRIMREQERLENASLVFGQVQELFDKEQIGILELNKAKIAWLQDQFVTEQLEAERRSTLFTLEKLNGGLPLTLEEIAFGELLTLVPFDSLWQSKLDADPVLAQLRKEEQASSRRIDLTKNQRLPNLTAGYNYQGVMGEAYSGLYGGISIPLWNDRNKVKAASAYFRYLENHTQAATASMQGSYQTQYNDYQLLLKKYDEYKRTLEGIESENLLMQAYRLGEISFISYYMELQFYRQAYDRMLEAELRLHQLKAELLKHLL